MAHLHCRRYVARQLSWCVWGVYDNQAGRFVAYVLGKETARQLAQGMGQ